MLTETSLGDIYTSITTLENGEWKHVDGSAVRHLTVIEAEDRVEMLIQGGAIVFTQAARDPDAHSENPAVKRAMAEAIENYAKLHPAPSGSRGV